MRLATNLILCVLTVICLVPLVEVSLTDDCPLPQESYPCYCEEDGGVTVLHCNHLNESKQIEQAMNELTNYKIQKVALYKTMIKSLKPDAFKGPQITQILFQNSTVSLESPQFVGQGSSLRRVTFLSCFDEDNTIGNWDLSKADALKDLTFDRNVIKVLKNDWLSKPGPNLKSLTFGECEIQKLEDKVFQKATNIATLFLNDNEISSISRSMFPMPADNLRSITLSNNKLQNLPDDIFEDMQSLGAIELQNNLLKTISESTWSSVIEDLSRVYLTGNPIYCDASLKWLSKVSLPGIFKGTCSGPKKVKGKDLRSLMPSDFH